MKKACASAVLFGLTAILWSAPAKAEPVTCPAEIEVGEQKLTKAMPGWEVFVDKVNTHMQLEAVALFDGKPENMVSLVPDKTTEGYVQWNFAENAEGKYYLACRYTNTSVQLVKALPATIKACRVTNDRGATTGGVPVIKDTICE